MILCAESVKLLHEKDARIFDLAEKLEEKDKRIVELESELREAHNLASGYFIDYPTSEEDEKFNATVQASSLNKLITEIIKGHHKAKTHVKGLEVERDALKSTLRSDEEQQAILRKRIDEVTSRLIDGQLVTAQYLERAEKAEVELERLRKALTKIRALTVPCETAFHPENTCQQSDVCKKPEDTNLRAAMKNHQGGSQ